MWLFWGKYLLCIILHYSVLLLWKILNFLGEKQLCKTWLRNGSGNAQKYFSAFIYLCTFPFPIPYPIQASDFYLFLSLLGCEPRVSQFPSPQGRKAMEPSPNLTKAAALGTSGGAAVLGGRLGWARCFRDTYLEFGTNPLGCHSFPASVVHRDCSLVPLKAPQKWFYSNELSGGITHILPQGPLKKRTKAIEVITGLFIPSFHFKIFPPSINHAGWANNPLSLLSSDVWHCTWQSPVLCAMGHQQMARGRQGRSRTRLPGQLSSWRSFLLFWMQRSACQLFLQVFSSLFCRAAEFL